LGAQPGEIVIAAHRAGFAQRVPGKVAIWVPGYKLMEEEQSIIVAT
jgi:hypothetical protein